MQLTQAKKTAYAGGKPLILKRALKILCGKTAGNTEENQVVPGKTELSER